MSLMCVCNFIASQTALRPVAKLLQELIWMIHEGRVNSPLRKKTNAHWDCSCIILWIIRFYDSVC